MPGRRFVLPLVFAVVVPHAAFGEPARDFCKGVKEQLSRDPALSVAATAAFPNARDGTSDDGCIEPLKVLRYGDADALISVRNEQGEACHGCPAVISAYVLRNTSSHPTVVARFLDFTSTGTYGNPGKIDAVQLAGHDAIAVESGGTFQGYTTSTVSFFVFESRRLVELKPFLPLYADNSGAMTDETKSITADGSWQVGPDQQDAITITYKVEARGRQRRTEATWVVDGSRLSLKSGSVPPEYHEAGGQ